MSWLTPLEILGLIAGSIGITMTIPQILRIRRLGVTEGVSVLTWALGLTACAAWFGYGLRTESLAFTVTNFVAACLHAWLLSLLIGSKLRRVFFIGFLPFAAAASALFLHEPAVIAALFVLAFTLWPQAIRSIAAAISRKPTPGVSLATWSIALASSSLWIAYGALSGRYVGMLASSIGWVAIVCILSATIMGKRRSAPVGDARASIRLSRTGSAQEKQLAA